MKKQTVYWNASLDVECPHCNHWFDFTETDDWIEQFVGVRVCEENKNVTCEECPRCEKKFVFDVEDGL